MVKDGFGRPWIMQESLEILEEYTGEALTIRQLYYRLVAAGLPNNLRMYKRVNKAMIDARWNGTVPFEAFIDRERGMVGETSIEDKTLEDEIESAKSNIQAWMTSYTLERWSNQPKYVEAWIEKKALQGVFQPPCYNFDTGLGPCKGYPSLSFLNEAAARFEEAQGEDKEVIMIYFGDHDPSGDDIPRSIGDNLRRMGCDITIERIALTGDQVLEMGLPPAPVKQTDSRSATWDGEGAVELDAVEPRTLRKMCEEAIQKHFDEGLYQELEDREDDERGKYREALQEFVNELSDEDQDSDDDEEEDEGFHRGEE